MNADKFTYTLAKGFFLAVFLLIVVFSSVQADAITDDYSAWVYTVPNALCHDPLLGPSFIIYSECGDDTSDREKEDQTVVHSVTPIPVIETIVPVVVDVPEDDTPIDDTPPVQDNSKQKCNNGFGNGADSACKTHGNAQNQDNTGKHQDGKDMSKQMNKEK